MTGKMSRLVRAGLLTGVTDGLFATVQSVLTPGSVWPSRGPLFFSSLSCARHGFGAQSPRPRE